MEARDIKGYDGLYKINELGHIFSYHRQGHLGSRMAYNIPPDHRWYPKVLLTKDGVRKTRSVHGLVAEAFIGERPAGMQVNHRNGEKNDPRLANLHYVTRSENALHAFRELHAKGGVTRGEAHHLNKLTTANVIDIRNDKLTDTHGYRATLARKYGVSQALISSILKRKIWKHI